MPVGGEIRQPDAANEDRRLVAGTEGLGDVEVGHHGGQLVGAGEVHLRDLVAAEGRHCDADVLQVLRAAFRRDDDLFEGRRRLRCHDRRDCGGQHSQPRRMHTLPAMSPHW